MVKKYNRKDDLNFRLYNIKKNWKLFYKSRYGKVGFYILLGFVIISLLSPLIIEHNNPLTYIAPEGDFTVADKQLTTSLPSQDKATYIAATTSTERGSFLVYASSQSHIYGVDICNNATYNLANIDNSYNLTAFTAYTTSGLLNTYVLTANSSELYIGHTAWTGFIAGSGTPSIVNKTIPISNITSAPFTSAFSYHYIYNDATLQCDQNSGSKAVYIYAITQNTTGYYLNEYYMYNLCNNDYKPVFSQKLPYNAAPENYEFYAAGLNSSHEEVLISQNSHLLGYSTRGALKTNVSINSDISEIYIPSGYQSVYKSYNQIFVSSTKSVYAIDPANNTNVSIFNIPSASITFISSTSGSTGFPSYFLIASSNDKVYVLNGPDSLSRTIKLGVDITGLATNAGNFIFYNHHGDYLYFTGDSLSSGSCLWSLSTAKSTSTPLFVYNALSARESISFTSGNTIMLYSTVGKDLNPIPPTFHTVTGNIFPLGTTTSGNDVWSMFIGSFPVYLEIGFSVGIGILLISVSIGMLIGYFSGIVSSGLETLALAIYLIPGLPLLIVVASIVGPSLLGIIMVLTLLSWPFAAFTLIGLIRGIKNRAFVDSAKVSGASTFQILKNHMLKNVTPILVYLTSINIGGAGAAVSTLQLLGIAPLSVPTWGGMLTGFFDNAFELALAPWWFIPPIIALTLFIMAFIFISRGMDNVVNPRAGGRR
jgi:peptide/nickel transport system permease protein